MSAIINYKTPKIERLLAGLVSGTFDRHYLGYFACFNEQAYYEAHDVLEALWLPLRGTPDARFYQGLIQLAGAFVHLQKERLGPASRLFALALTNFADYPAWHEGIDLGAVRELCRGYCARLLAAPSQTNPWSPATAPRLTLPSPGPPENCLQLAD